MIFYGCNIRRNLKLSSFRKIVLRLFLFSFLILAVCLFRRSVTYLAARLLMHSRTNAAAETAITAIPAYMEPESPVLGVSVP